MGNSVVTVPVAPPAIPAAPAPLAAIPPAPVNLGPAPADTVTQQKILAPVRTHTRITPQATNIIPQINVQNYNVDVPVHVPTPVEREVIVNKHVPAPYEVAVPRAVHVAAPYKVHPVQEIVETPHVHHATYTTHHKQPVVTPHSTRPSTFPCTLSRPTSSPELPTLRPPPLPTSPPLLTALTLVLATPPLVSSDMWLLPTKCSQTTHSTSRLCNPKTSISLFMFGNCSLFRRLIFR